MAITSYQVDTILNAYTRKSNVSISRSASIEGELDSQDRDTAILSSKEDNKSEEFEKISDNLRDVLLKDENV